MHRRVVLGLMESRTADIFVNEKFQHIDGQVNKIVDSKLLAVFSRIDENTIEITSTNDKMKQLDLDTTSTLDKFEQAARASSKALHSRMKSLEEELPVKLETDMKELLKIKL